MRNLVGLACMVIWVCGIVIANGFWSTFFAVIIPIWSYYLVAERVLQMYGVI